MAFRIMLRRFRTALAFWSCLFVTGCFLTSAEALAVDCDIVPTASKRRTIRCLLRCRQG